MTARNTSSITVSNNKGEKELKNGVHESEKKNVIIRFNGYI